MRFFNTQEKIQYLKYIKNYKFLEVVNAIFGFLGSQNLPVPIFSPSAYLVLIFKENLSQN